MNAAMILKMKRIVSVLHSDCSLPIQLKENNSYRTFEPSLKRYSKELIVQFPKKTQ